MKRDMETQKLVKVSTQKEFMDELGILHADENKESGAGRPRDLKAYIIETDKPLQTHYQMNGLALEISNTGLDHIKILTAKSDTSCIQYYVDKTDDRFIVLHTNALATNSDKIATTITSSNTYQFDSAWLHTDMLKFLATNFGNKSIGYAIRYEDIFKDDSVMSPKNDLSMDITGDIANTVLDIIKKNNDITQVMGYERVTFYRGTGDDAIREDMRYNGRFRLAKGDSIDEHVSLIQYVVNKYRDTIQYIEKERISGKESPGGFLIDGNAFTFEFKRSINNWGIFLPRIFNTQVPFRIWGLPIDGEGDVQKVLCVDMHTGDQLDVEVGEGMMRAYLPDGACGNVILRLYTNLQRYVDADVRCSQLRM